MLNSAKVMKLISLGIIKKSSQVTIRYRSASSFGVNSYIRDIVTIEDWKFLKHTDKKGNIVLVVYSIRDGLFREIKPEQIVEIDGMCPKRLFNSLKLEA